MISARKVNEGTGWPDVNVGLVPLRRNDLSSKMNGGTGWPEVNVVPIPLRRKDLSSKSE